MDTNLGKIPMEKVCVREGTWCEYVKERDFISNGKSRSLLYQEEPFSIVEYQYSKA